MLQLEDVKKPSGSNVPRTITGTDKTGVGRKQCSDIKDIKSVRQLFSLFKRESFNAVLYDDVRICDVYCGPSTKHIYTKYINGIHLVHAQYNWYSKELPRLYFRFPTVDDWTLKITAMFLDDMLYHDAVQLLYHHHKKPILLFAEFNDGFCTISSMSQLIPL